MSRVKVEKFYDEPAATCDPALVGALEAAVARAGVTPHRLPSGAGHDGARDRRAVPDRHAVRPLQGRHQPQSGRSRSPTRDADVAIRVLLDFLRHFPEPPNAH